MKSVQVMAHVLRANSSQRFRLRLTGLPGLLAAIALTFAGCSKPDDGTAATADGRHALTGSVVSVLSERGSLLVAHDDIPGVMPPMTMEFKVNPGDLRVVREGMRIRGKMYQLEDGFYLEEIWPLDPTSRLVVEGAEQQLRQDTVTRGSGAFREVGENLPDFALYDQAGRVVSSSRFRGRQVVLNFIFTRCPDPNMCPATVMKMMQLQSQAREAGIADLELVSITLDPEYDTPGVLNDYADARAIDTSNYSFLTGPEGAIKDLLSQLGVLAFQNGPLIQHTLATVLINEQGRIVHRVDGSQWQPADFMTRLRRPEPVAAPASP